MTVLQSIVLGIVQGLTEFLPISSSGHLVLIPRLLGWQLLSKDAFVFDVLVQVATLLAVIIYYFPVLKDIVVAMYHDARYKKFSFNGKAGLGWLILVATLPAGIIGLLIKGHVEMAFSSPHVVALSLIVTGFLLILSELIGKRLKSIEQISIVDAIVIGLFQVLAIFPGISRSGATITGGMVRKLNRESAANFSFLMSIPIMLAAGFVSVIDLVQLPDSLAKFGVFFPGFVVSAVVGYLSIRWLLTYLRSRSLLGFAVYCLVVGIVGLILL